MIKLIKYRTMLKDITDARDCLMDAYDVVQSIGSDTELALDIWDAIEKVNGCTERLLWVLGIVEREKVSR